MPQAVSPQTALVYVMVLVAAADQDMTDQEVILMSDFIRILPVFDGYDVDTVAADAETCVGYLQDEDGLDKVLDVVNEALPPHLGETAYALACDIAAADGDASQTELRLLEMLRHRLGVGRLPAAAIERGARARAQTL